jgi:hypothetical protein
MVGIIRGWCGSALLLLVAVLVQLCLASKKHTNKPVSPNCISKVQRSMDCILSSDNEWVAGKRMDYDYMKVLSKSEWDTCNRPVHEYQWNFSSSCAKHSLKKMYSQQQMCEIVSGKNIMIVGDSISNQMFVTFASMMWPSVVLAPTDDNFQHFDKKIFKDKDGVVTSDYKDSGYNNVAINIPCEDLKHSFTLLFVRNFNLSVNTEADDIWYSGDGQIYRDVPRPWIERIGKLFYVAWSWSFAFIVRHSLGTENVDYLILNRGAHFSKTILEDLETTFSTLAKKYPRLKVMWRNTPMGHVRCDDTMESAPLTEPPDPSRSGPEFHWNTFGLYNRKIREMIEKKFPQVTTLL